MCVILVVAWLPQRKEAQQRGSLKEISFKKRESAFFAFCGWSNQKLLPNKLVANKNCHWSLQITYPQKITLNSWKTKNTFRKTKNTFHKNAPLCSKAKINRFKKIIYLLAILASSDLLHSKKNFIKNWFQILKQ